MRSARLLPSTIARLDGILVFENLGGGEFLDGVEDAALSLLTVRDSQMSLVGVDEGDLAEVFVLRFPWGW